jgi:IQ motif/SEC7 domain-containing protein
MLIGIYNRIQVQEFRAGVDHVTQVMKVEQTVVGKKPVSRSQTVKKPVK